ncbi:MAG TPA: isochorismatase family cysteine hydrolase, partial [Chloroflexota bacterium]|nr:isochorismatase family cysteine hydrolase [Chloroflexota bacterium]
EFYEGIEPRQSADWDPARHDFVVTKHRYSGFVGTELELVLRAQGIRTLLMTGTASDGCVEATARDGFMRDFGIVYVSDCSAASTVEKHEALLQRIRQIATVAAASEIAGVWQRTGAALQAAG